MDDEGEQEEWRDTLVTIERPRYGADQTLGPINVAAAHARLARAYDHHDRHSPSTGPVLATIRNEEQSHE